MNYPIFHFKRSQLMVDRESTSSSSFPAPPISAPSLPVSKQILSPELWQISEPPEELFIQGNPKSVEKLALLPEKGLAIVGTRSPQTRSLVVLKKVIESLRHSELILISGFARGIDTAAHTSAIDAGLLTVAILGAGLNIPYPRENEDLRKRLLDAGGLLVSEFPPDTPARGFHFLRRNRIIAGWAKATWVVEASQRSGALNTARWAREQNRTCFALPCFPGDPAFAGNQTLLDRDHAIALWNTHSLGTEWLDLASTFTATQNSSMAAAPKNPRAAPQIALQIALHPLIREVQTATGQKGGVELQELFDWAATQGLSSEQFFTTLQTAVQENAIIHRNGSFTSV